MLDKDRTKPRGDLGDRHAGRLVRSAAARSVVEKHGGERSCAVGHPEKCLETKAAAGDYDCARERHGRSAWRQTITRCRVEPSERQSEDKISHHESCHP